MRARNAFDQGMQSRTSHLIDQLPWSQSGGVEPQKPSVVLAQMLIAEAFGLQAKEDQDLQKRQHARIPEAQCGSSLSIASHGGLQPLESLFTERADQFHLCRYPLNPSIPPFSGNQIAARSVERSRLRTLVFSCECTANVVHRE